ncbi:MAG: hypothetical protein JJE40_03985, partial [Vicinamibacteria bacterium]|nr:hypothetical protein [Vicinamibacteria bacterium]
AILYLGAHCWAVGAYLVTVEHAASLLPSSRAVKAFWGRHWPKVVVTAAIVAVEHAPMTLWRAVGHFLNCGS